MKTVIRVELLTNEYSDECNDEILYTNLKKAIIQSGLNYNTLKKFKLPFEYKNFLFEKVEIL